MKTYFKYIISILFMATAAYAEVTPALYVELLIYSGRPNPTLLITDPKIIQEVTGLVKTNPENSGFAKGTVTPAKLGYRGFAVENLSTVNSEIEAFSVYGSDIEVKEKSAPTERRKGFRKDKRGVLEQKLIRLLEEKGLVSPELMSAIKNAK